MSLVSLPHRLAPGRRTRGEVVALEALAAEPRPWAVRRYEP
jgi:hypothetical protein